MKFFIYALILAAVPVAAFAGEWDYNVESGLRGAYGYTDIKKHNHGVGQGNIDSSVYYSFDDSSVVSLHLDLMFGVDQELQDYNQGRWGEEAYGVLDSPYGQIMLGQVYNVASLFHNAAPSVGILNSNNDVVDFIVNPNWRRTSKETKFATLNSTDINTDGVAPKINYVSPEFYGAALGFSYVPNSYNRRGLENKHAGYAHKDGFVGALYHDGDWNLFESKISLGYAQYHGNDKEFSSAMTLSRGNWSLGGGVRKTYIDGENKAKAETGLPTNFDGYREGFAWNVGIGYEIGPFSSSVSYFDSKSDHSKNRNKIVAFSNQYQFNKNIDVYAAAAHLDYDADFDSGSGYALIVGVGVNF